MSIESAYQFLYMAALIWLALLIGAMLIRSVMGPETTDRILCINMIGTLVVACIAILSRLLEEEYLLDVALLYTMISFVAVLILAATYIPSRKRRDRHFRPEEETEPEEIRKEDGRNDS